MGDPGVGGGMFGGCAEVLLILFVLWIVSVIVAPRERKRKARAAEREMIQACLDAEDQAWLALCGERPGGYDASRGG